MEWLIGMVVGLLVFLIVGGILEKIISDEDVLSVCSFIAWIIFGLAVEIPDRNPWLMKISDGKVIETKKMIVIGWDAPEYSDKIQQFEGKYVTLNNKFYFHYKIYYRVIDENLNDAQKYYNEVVRKRNNDLESVNKDMEVMIARNLDAEVKITPENIKKIAEDYLKNFGIKVIGV
ncbi:MAG: hypothetical protein AAB851_02590 [Patescibacteria group bacterium]